MTYVTAEEVKGYAKIDYKDLGYETESEFNSFLSGLISQVEGIIESHCNVPSGFFKDGGKEISETLDYRNPLMLRYYPVLAISQIQFNMADYGEEADWQTINSKYYRWNKHGIIHFSSDLSAPPVSAQSVKVTYTAGYTSMPQAIKNVCLMLAGNILHAILQRKISPVVRIDEFTVKFVVPDVFTDEMRRILAPFVCRSFSVG